MDVIFFTCFSFIVPPPDPLSSFCLSVFPSFAQSPDGSMFWIVGQLGEIISVGDDIVFGPEWFVLGVVGLLSATRVFAVFRRIGSTTVANKIDARGNRIMILLFSQSHVCHVHGKGKCKHDLDVHIGPHNQQVRPEFYMHHSQQGFRATLVVRDVAVRFGVVVLLKPQRCMALLVAFIDFGAESCARKRPPRRREKEVGTAGTPGTPGTPV